jgi:hypothetical protein
MTDKERLLITKDFVDGRKSLYQEELGAAASEIEEFVYSKLIALLDEISQLVEEEVSQK